VWESVAVRRGRKEGDEGEKEKKEKGKEKEKERERERERDVTALFAAATAGLDEHARRSATRSALRGTRKRKRCDGD
jgi:hypothetical protein